jgi:hypothetical protein
MVSSGMLHRVALVRTDVSEELSASFITVTRIGELGTTLTVTSNRRTLRRNKNLKSYTCYYCMTMLQRLLLTGRLLNWKGSGKKRRWPAGGTVPEIPGENEGSKRNIKNVGESTGIGKEQLPNTSLQHYQ